MPLTPTDVANKQFKIAFRGYALEEVDAFLDEVEGEIGRLLRDNSELRREAGAAGSAPAGPGPGAPVTGTPAGPVARTGSREPGAEGQEAALRTLLLAQRTADEAVAEARAEAEQMVGAAREEAERTLTSARQEADQTLTSARRDAEQTLSSARQEADSTLSAARLKASQVDQEVAARITAATGNLDQRRAQLETHIEELRAFEREYRTRLKAYLENQLRELTGRSASDGDGGAGVPVGARAAAIGLAPGGVSAIGPAEPGRSADQGSALQVTAPPAGSDDDRSAGDRG